jgi:hypothetical protein
MEALFALVMRKDETTGRTLAILALEMLRDLVMGELQVGNLPEAGECRDTDSGMIPQTLSRSEFARPPCQDQPPYVRPATFRR